MGVISVPVLFSSLELVLLNVLYHFNKSYCHWGAEYIIQISVDYNGLGLETFALPECVYTNDGTQQTGLATTQPRKIRIQIQPSRR